MSKTAIIWISSAVLMAVGILIFVAAMSAVKWDFSKLQTDRFETVTHDITDSFSDVKISVGTSDVKILPAQDGAVKVVLYEGKKLRHSVSVTNGALEISTVDERQWFHHIGFNFSSPSVTVYLPEEELGKLSITGSTGRVEVSKGATFDTVDVSLTTGDIWCFASANTVNLKATTSDVYLSDVSANSVSLSVTSGDITAKNLSVKDALSATSSTGDSDFTNVECGSLSFEGRTGNITLKNLVSKGALNCSLSTGDVIFDRSDAADITVVASTGDVIGSLLSPKIFTARTSTGSVKVPTDDKNGGWCEIRLTTGDINITIAE